MLLGQLFKSVNKKFKKNVVKGISFDSRKIKRGDIFFAINGKKTSGANFIKEATSKGASAIVCSSKIKFKTIKIPIIFVKDVRKSLSEACSKYYKKKPRNIIAVTGTNGKSSVAYFFYQILRLNRISVASIGTLGIFHKNYIKKTKLTSLDSLSLNKNLETIKKGAIDNVILEASSHGLEQKRLDGLRINTGIFTNLSHDHLDYHLNMNSYFKSKMYLFKTLLKKNSNIITDEDIKEFKVINKVANNKKIKKITIGTNSGNIRILNNQYKENKQLVKIFANSKIFLLEIPLIGNFQLKNLFMAVAAASTCSSLSLNKILDQLKKIKPVPGRLECIANLKNNSNIIVDFAHTPDALEQSLLALKKQFKKEIVLIFGCGGERDKKKRFPMGQIARKYCRKIIVTDDNPRNENPKKIRKTIIKGCGKLATDIGNRKAAIKTGIQELKANEVLLIAGKGHEEVQDYGNKIINFSDKKIVKKILKKGNFLNKKISSKQIIAEKVFKNIKNMNYDGVSINTKTLKRNNLFFAIKGKNNDGHKFVKEAIKKGAVKSVVNKKMNFSSKNKFIRVKNTLSSLNNLAKITRSHFFGNVIGITGSVGKTTSKNLIGFALKNYGKVYQSPHSFNNKFGVPLSISNLKDNTEYGIFEIGMDKKGEIDKLSKIVKPEIAIITNISEAHFKNFRTLKDIAKAKGEIIDNISENGNLILNKDDKFFDFLSKKAEKKGVKVTSFSAKKKADIFLGKIKKVKNHYRLKIFLQKEAFYFDTMYSTRNFINNFLSCITVLHILNLDLKKIGKKFINFTFPQGRGDITIIRKFKKRFKFVDESYNASPLSMKSAIKNINSYEIKEKGKKIVFLGDMLELGSKSRKLHRELSLTINRSNIDKVFVHGKFIKETFNLLSESKKGKVFGNLKEAYSHLSKILRNNDLLMVKGSNATGLNQFSKNIKKGQINAV